jgi:hypothetical protein
MTEDSILQAIDDPNAAPLEQNIKNLECDGTPFRVVREDVTSYRYVSLIFDSLIFVVLATGHLTKQKRLQEIDGTNL